MDKAAIAVACVFCWVGMHICTAAGVQVSEGFQTGVEFVGVAVVVRWIVGVVRA
jgi:hypothetical protein